MEYPELIGFFASNRVAEIQDVDGYKKYCEKNVNSFGFSASRDKTEMAKKTIEEHLEPQSTGADQIRHALKLLEARRHLDFDRYYALIVAGYKPNWSKDQQGYFEHAVRIIRSGNYFFLSFTSRPSEEGLADKRINRRYRHFIKRTIRRPTESDRRNRNLLADAIDTMLRDEALDGFYYKRHDNDNSVVEKKLLAAATSCLVFVQLVDNAMFDPRGPNYCEHEYRNALEFIREIASMVDNRILFLVTEKDPKDLPDPDTVHAPYKDWVHDVLKKSAVYLPPSPDYDKQNIVEIRDKIARVISQVKEAKRNMLNCIPN